MDPYKAVRNVLLVTLGLNLAVAAAKVTYGLMTQSLSMVADGFHSFFDGTSNIVGLLGIWMASHPPDTDHPYGHKKYEALASLGISLLLFLACYHILSPAWVRLTDSLAPEVTFWSYGVILATIAVNSFTVTYERRKAEELESAILHHDAMHTRSDLLASLSVLASLAATQMGFPLIDPIAALGIALLIGRTGFEILLEATRVLSDASMIRPDMI
ncbi:MAG: cation transporter, partial [Nitrospirae bacterium]|nr:cation transporter [Nitrospirota bacterium]